MRYCLYILILFLLCTDCLAQQAQQSNASTFGASTGSKIIIGPPLVKEKVDPCAEGQCDFGKKQKKRRGFGHERKKAVSSFGKGKNTKKSKAINGAGKKKSRARRHYRRHR